MSSHAPPPAADSDADDVGRWGLTRSERLAGLAALAAAIALVAVLIAAFWQPAPPRRVVMSSGAAGGAYEVYARRYREILARSGVELVLKPSAGALENLQRLRERRDGVTLALVQGGLAQPGDEDKMVSLGAVNYEPLWLFHRTDHPLAAVTDLRGLRIAGGPPGSGTRQVVDLLLGRLGLATQVPPVRPLWGIDAADALERGEVDAAFLVAAPDAPAVRRLLQAPGIELLSWRRADAYVRQFPMLSRVDIPEGAFDLQRNLPAHDTALLALKADLVASPDIHPVLVDLLLDAAREVHGGPGLIRRAGEFPQADATEYPMSSDAVRWYKSGPSMLRRYLPYPTVVWIQRLLFFGLPLLAVGVPLARVTPLVYRWSVRRRIYRWYGELSFLERAMQEGHGDRDTQLRRLDAIEARVNRLRVPASFAGEAYTLRMHVQMVRARLAAV
jgi:TRAP-type uncharacterized transport system substrate-binding protein